LRLLGGRYERHAIQKHLAERRMFDPIVLAGFGVALPCTGTSGLFTIGGLSDFDVGGRVVDFLQLRVCNDDPCFAPAGHSVIQTMLPTRYDWWAMRGTRYGAEKEALAERLIAKLEPLFPDLRPAIRMVDVATPLTYWRTARSWRGAYEGWLPTSDAFTGHIGKKLSGLEGFYMAGQWVEPGGGVPVAMMSGRQAVQLICNDEGLAFVAGSEGLASTGKNVA
jgi:hypothetical protein